MVSTLGRIVVPLAVQQTVDGGIEAKGGPDVRRVAILVTGAAVLVVLTAMTSYVVNVRLFKATEAGLMSLRVKAFRHVHDLSVLTQNSERRGSMVSRVTSDVDTISQFVQFGGLQLLLSVGQLLIATILMAIYSPLLTLLVWLCFAPMLIGARFFQRRVSAAYQAVRERVAACSVPSRRRSSEPRRFARTRSNGAPSGGSTPRSTRIVGRRSPHRRASR